MKRWLSIILTVLLVVQPFAVSELAYATDGTTVMSTDTEPATELKPAEEVPNEDVTDSDSTSDVTTEPEASEEATSETEPVTSEEKTEAESNVIEEAKTSEQAIYSLAEPSANQSTEDKELDPILDIPDNILDSYTVTTTNTTGSVVNVVTTESLVKIDYNWSIPNEHPYVNGSTFRFTVPPELRVFQKVENVSLNFVDDLGETRSMGTFNVDLAGNATIVFNDNVTQFSDIKGTVQILTQVKATTIISEENTVVITPIQDKLPFSLRVGVKQPAQDIVKSGLPNRVYNTETINWTIEMNRGLKPIKNAKLTDVIPYGLSYKPGTLKVERLILDMSGAVKGVEPYSSFTETYEIDTLSLAFGDVEQAFRITFETDVIDEETSTFLNKATLTGEDYEPLPATATIVVKRGVELDKRVVDYTDSTQTIKWEAKINYRQKELGDLTVTDYFTNTHKLTNFTLYRIELDDDGNEKMREALPLTPDLIQKTGFDGFTFNLPENKMAYLIEYETTAKERVFNSERINNEISIGTLTDTAGQNTGQAILRKSHRTPNYQNETIGWRIEINRDRREMQNAILTDIFPNDGLTLDIASIELTGLVKDTDYTVEETTVDGRNGFILTFLKPVTEMHILTYTTAFDYASRLVKSEDLQNRAMIDWKEVDQSKHSITVNDVFKPSKYSRENGFKGGTYNAVNKLITWSLGVNFHEYLTENLKVVDTWSSEQVPVKESFQIVPITRNEGADSYDVTGSPLELDAYDLLWDDASNTFTLTIKGETKQAYLITYNTSLDDQVTKPTYTNDAIVTITDQDPNNLSASVSVKHGGEHVGKSGIQSDKLITWTVPINYGQSTLEDVVIQDEPSVNQEILQDGEDTSIVIYETTVDSAGNVQKAGRLSVSAYTVKSTESGGFILSFNETISRPYILTYDSLILDKPGAEISNEITLNAKQLTKDSQKTSSTVVVEVTTGQGTAEGKVGALKLEKLDAETKEKLEGAEFVLKIGSRIIRRGTTDADGLLTFKRLLYGNYTLEEVTPPTGYVAISKSMTVRVNDTSASSPREVRNNKVRQDVRLTKTSGTASGAKLEGATFTLFKKAVAPMVSDSVIIERTTDANGVLTITDLDPGDYYFVETKAPINHLLDNQTKHTFVIQHNQLEVTLVNVSNQPFKSIEFSKVDWKNGTRLTGATFDLEDADGTKLRTGLTVDATGVLLIEDLDLGAYRLIETTAPDGYVLPKDPVPFTVTLASPAIQKQTITNETMKSVKLTKRDKDTNVPLQGAVFQLLDANNTVVRDNVTTGADGTVTVDHLPIGTYTFVEKTAPTGYILDTKRHSFSVEYGQDTVEEVAIDNEQQKSVRLIKTDVVTGRPLADATFALTDGTGNVLQSNLKTDANGEILVTNLNPGSYRFVETSAPGGYMTDGTPYPFTLMRGTNVTAEVRATNDSFKAVRLVKTDNLTSVRLAGAEFSLVNASGTIIRNGLVTDANGEVYVSGLVPGDYAFVETKAPSGYLLDTKRHPFSVASRQSGATVLNVTNEQKKAVRLVKTDVTTGKRLAGATFTLQTTGGEIVKPNLMTDALGEIYINDLLPGDYVFIETAAPNGYILDATPRPFSIKTGTNEVVTVAMANDTFKSVRLVKTDSVNGTPLVGATFDLVDETGIVLKQGLRTNVQGELIVDGLLPGTYAFVEKAAPSGYLLDATPRPFTLVRETVGHVDVTITNDTEKTIVLTKQDRQTDKPLAGATFVLKDAAGNTIRDRLISDKYGRIVVDGLAPGDYTFIEVKAPTGYQLDTTAHVARVTKNQRQATELIVTNEQLKEVIVEKVDANSGKRLEGAQFELFDTNGIRIARMKTDEDGRASVKNLSNGTYTLVETNAPRGYLLDPSEHTIRLIAGGTVTLRLVVENTVDPDFEFDDSTIPGGAGNPDSEKPKQDEPDVEFGDPNVPTGAGTPDQATSDKGKLPFLGMNASNSIWFGLSLFVIGIGLFWSTRRRQTN